MTQKPKDAPRAARAQRVGIVDAVTTGERGADERRHLVSGVRPARRLSEIDVAVDELPQAETLAERGRRQQPRVGYQAVVVKGYAEPVGAAR